MPARTKQVARTKPLAVTSARMRKVRQTNTAPEQSVRRLLRELGVGYRIAPRDLPGRPDIANKANRWAIFVHGCFWHGHDNCSLATVPKTNTQWWTDKISANQERDARKEGTLGALGYRVCVVWQCEISEPAQLSEKLRRFLRL
jgi:DNA mismatch endonuclease, patch repair protein